MQVSKKSGVLNMSSIAEKISLALFVFFLAVCGIAMSAVVINEVELSPPDNGSKWVELYNTGNEVVDLGDWMVTFIDGPWNGPIKLSGQIESKGFYVADGDPRWAQSINGTVTLTNNGGNVVDKTPEFSDTAHNDFTWSRIPDGKNTGTKTDFAFIMGSKGRSNGGSSGPIVLGSVH
jgi:hypothetical protein